jgi:hypothetical protein
MGHRWGTCGATARKSKTELTLFLARDVCRFDEIDVERQRLMSHTHQQSDGSELKLRFSADSAGRFPTPSSFHLANRATTPAPVWRRSRPN